MKIIMVRYNQFFTISSSNFDKLVTDVKELNNRFTTIRQDRFFDRKAKKMKVKYIEDQKFYAINYIDQTIHYLFSTYGIVVNYLRGLGYTIEESKVLPKEGKKIELQVKFKPRDKQKPYLNAFVKSTEPTLLIDAIMGFGKTVVASMGFAKLKRRFGVIVLPRYIDKWKKDLSNYLELSEENGDFYTVQGGKSLRVLMEMSEEERDSYKVILYSLKTIILYINEYLDINKPFTYEVAPLDLMNHLEIGYLLNDESHQEFHNVVKVNLFFNVKKFIGLTGTLEHKNRTLEKMYKYLFPNESRVDVEEDINRYITVYSIRFKFSNINKVNTINNFGYSQINYEKSIYRRSTIRDNYTSMISKLVKKIYIEKPDFEKGDKCLIFAATIKMCEVITDKLKKEHPGFKITKYTSDDDYNVIDESDIIVSTPGSASTALDISNLVTVIQTVSLDSLQINKQTLGRLRPLDNKEVVFAYIWSPQIKPHYFYARNRLEYFSKMAKKTISITYHNPI